ncbi:2-oxoglutarate dehydrogenase, E1 protein [Geotalea daltonii FRC-32]|uniref:oxoglutarate dehydrogenase (succinyl-transferring) n=1 Tax=Geotalea daltonii (strain DSM 22248 / JCM 15807 / FRC-32) TaxID=316067 RepID=B9M839_GEODF|nr:2-oxoglutarate dehydrogenase E1 component [Geotalea daltonii]ACM20305.1 2-oxoglutarate dehydrogenase, E1 protein [Geotalea daltonii FRC-32]
MPFNMNFSPEWIEEQYLLWQEHPERLPVDLQAFFNGFELGLEGGEGKADLRFAIKQSAVQSLIYRYRDIGHLLACTDPLSPCQIDHPLLSLEAFGLDASDLDKVFHTRRFMKESATLREILQVMHDTYCRSIGVEFMHIQEPAERQWLMDRMEPVRNSPSFSIGQKQEIAGHIYQAALFEAFLNRKFAGQTRFSLEGGESLIPLLKWLMAGAAERGVTDLILGMPHRGRLNVLANVFDKPLEEIFAEFADNSQHGIIGEGDVKYHKGYSIDVTPVGGHTIHLTLAANPSHLEAIDPVVEGKCRARQDRCCDSRGDLVLPVLIHGDAAFSGQGVVAETFNLSQLEGYRTGGTVHIVLNNQIGFTTLAADARSSCYATDGAKMVQAPVFHVQGDDPEAVVHATRLALEYRQAFRRDVVVEVICYRRYGHNEGDEPYFTQPLMYEKIKNRQPLHELYAMKLRDEGVDGAELEKLFRAVSAHLEAAIGQEATDSDVGFREGWGGIERDYAPHKVETGVGAGELISMMEVLTAFPDGFTPHPKLATLLKRRLEAVKQGNGIDWATAENLAFASLLQEGTSLRLSGQDVRRGTFSQRHCTFFDYHTEKMHVPLAALAKDNAVFNAYDSMLSEYAVLGFEYGYSVESPLGLTVWEAQYGDFANGAQVVIDQFVSSGESKWDRGSGLVLLLPHGYEGQGAEHSSARIERFLQLCAMNNMQVCYPTTPAQYFHLLRRQVKQPFRKPLVIFTPKSLLRNPLCVSTLDDFGGWFREILPAEDNPDKVRQVLICSGKIYFELLKEKMAAGREDVALVRIEQLYPLRLDLLRDTLLRYRQASFRWVQEEPRNMGAWIFIRPQLEEITGGKVAYVGREEEAAPAVGSHRQHMVEQERVINDAFA